MEVSNKTLVVCVVVVGFVFGSLLLMPFLLVGAGCGFVFELFFSMVTMLVCASGYKVR